MRLSRIVALSCALSLLGRSSTWAQDRSAASGLPDQVLAEIERQRQRIEELERAVARQDEALSSLRAAMERQAPATRAAGTETRVGSADGRVTEAQAERREPEKAQQALIRKAEETARNLGGFRFSGDYRHRVDIAMRSSNPVAGPLQNVRHRYRLRFNIDKELDPHFKFHLQLSTGQFNNGATNDQDFATMVGKHPFGIAEAHIDFALHSNLLVRLGRMEEIFADSMNFAWDDDVRFNGLPQVARFPLGSKPLRLKSIEVRAAQYVLSNPNIAVLRPDSPFVAADFVVGKKVGDSNLFHTGFMAQGELGGRWSHQLTADVQIYRNPNQIQLASLPIGYAVLINNGLGLALSGPLLGVGNATTTPGGAVYYARGFQIARISWRLAHEGFRVGDRLIPAWLDIQLARNTATTKLRDAIMAALNVGAVRKSGDLRFLYFYTIKDANSLISQFSDDNLGTLSGVNLEVHQVRMDIGITRFFQLQNRMFIQQQRRQSNPEQHLFVPLPRGANPIYRFQTQLAFSF